MPITDKNLDEAIQQLDQIAKRYEDAAMLRLEHLGLQCVAMVRDASMEESWCDQTGNLRSSIGYVIAKDGQIVKKSSFATVLNGAEGAALGETYARHVASTSRGLALIVVAGEHYAEQVEAIEGKTVLAAAALFAENQLPRIMDKLKRDIQ